MAVPALTYSESNPCSSSTAWQLFRNADSQCPQPLLNQNLQLHKTLRWSGFSLQSERTGLVSSAGDGIASYLSAWTDCPTLGLGRDVTSSRKLPMTFLSHSCLCHVISEHPTLSQWEKWSHFYSQAGQMDNSIGNYNKLSEARATCVWALVLNAHWIHQREPCVQGLSSFPKWFQCKNTKHISLGFKMTIWTWSLSGITYSLQGSL